MKKKLNKHGARQADKRARASSARAQRVEAKGDSGRPAEANDAARLFQTAFENHRAGRAAEAEALYRAVLKIESDHPHALNNLAILLKNARRFPEAEATYMRALARSPEDPGPRSNLACLLSEVDRNADAVRVLQTAIALLPDYPDGMFNLGNCLRNVSRQEDAITAYRRALRLRPGMAEALANKGEIHRERAELIAARDCFLTALKARPDLTAPYNNLGETLKEMGLLDEAVAVFHEGLRLHPDEAPMHSNFLFILNYMPNVPPALVHRAHIHWGQKHSDPKAPASPRFDLDRSPDRRLRIGYVSPDFCTHSCAYFSEPLIEAHDRSAVEVYLYPSSRRRDRTTERFRAMADKWTPLPGMTDAEAQARIRADKVDILVDMAGHTCDNRLAMFALRPAPIQASWLGYPNTTGARAIDYRITDPWADPMGRTDPLHVETLVRLPTGFMTFRPVIDAAPDPVPPSARSGRITFGSFNNTSKVTPEVVRVWAEIMARTPGSRLVLKSRQLGDESVRKRYAGLFADRGIDAGRIDLLARIEPVTNHLRAYDQIDIALDPFPYNGTTTTCEALWMGVPVVALEGESHVARVGVSILARCGLAELIGRDEADYIDRAVKLAGDAPRLAALRAGMRARLNASPLTGHAAFARAVEAGYRLMWRRWLSLTGA
jgi:protein O-GlcNAc transferase